MSILAWIVLGLIAGFIASKLVNKTGGGLVLDLVLGVVGAFVGGFLFAQFGAGGVSGLNIYSILACKAPLAVWYTTYFPSGLMSGQAAAPGTSNFVSLPSSRTL